MNRPASLEEMLERLRQVVENPVPVRVILSRSRYTALELEIERSAYGVKADPGRAFTPSLAGVRLDVVDGGPADYGEVLYSNGSRRPV